VLRLLVAGLTFASFLLAVDPGDHVQKSAAVGSATGLVLNADVGTIRVAPGGGKNVDVEVYFHGSPFSQAEFDRMRRDFTLDVLQQGSDVRVTGAFHKGWEPMADFWPIILGGRSMCRDWKCLEYGRWLRGVEYRVSVPATFNADVQTSDGAIYLRDLDGEMNARTSGGGITLEGGKGKAVMHTSGGPIRIAQVTGDLDASTSGGSISIERNLGRVRARTSGGSIEIREAAGAIDASTAGGSVSASLVGQPKEDTRLFTSGGSIDVRLNRNVHVDLDASASGGGVWTDFDVPNRGDRHPNELRAPLNGGGPRLYLHSSGGGVNVRHVDSERVY
jgi:hypothetical protein